MFVLDLFNTDHERRVTEGAVDQLEQRRIDDLAIRMDDLVARAKTASNAEAKQALMKEFQKCKAERDSYYKVREGTVTPTATGLRHHAKPENYGGYKPEDDPLARLNKHAVNRADKAMDIKFNREKKYQGGLDVDEADLKKNSKQVNEAQLTVGDPIVVTGPNEFEGKTGEIYELSPSGKFVIVDLYNHGRHSMHLSDVEYNQYADDQEEDDWYDEVAEGGYNDYDNNRKGFGRDENLRNRERNAGLETEQNNIQISINGQPWKVVPGRGYADSREEREYLNNMRRWAEKKSATSGKKWTVSLTGANPTVNELSTEKLAQYKKAAGADAKAADKAGNIERGNKRFKGIVRATIKQGDNDAKKHAQDKKDMELGEESSTASNAVERAILNRIMVAHTDLLMKFGPDKVMQAAEEVAYDVGDVDEIGTSDVSAYVNQVRQILGA